jgi:hypothetical protein
VFFGWKRKWSFKTRTVVLAWIRICISTFNQPTVQRQTSSTLGSLFQFRPCSFSILAPTLEN